MGVSVDGVTKRARNYRTDALSWLLAALIGTMLSVAAWHGFRLREDHVAELEFRARTSDYHSIIQNGINDYLDKLLALQSLFSSMETVSRQQFVDFSKSLLSGSPAILAVSWVPRVTRADREAHEKAGVSEGYIYYGIKEQHPNGELAAAPIEEEYFPVFYSSVATPTTRWIGTNMNDNDVRGRTLARARSTRKLATSERLALLSGTGDGSGFFVMVPVYRAEDHHSGDGSSRDLRGIVQGVFQTRMMIERIIGSALPVAGGIDLYFFAPNSSGLSTLQHFHPSRLNSAPAAALDQATIEAGAHRAMPLTVGDVQWTLVARPIAGGVGTAARTGSWAVLSGGLAFTLLVSTFLWSGGRYSRRLLATNETLDHTLSSLDSTNTQLLAQNVRFDAALNNMTQGLVMFDANERMVVCNNRYIEMYNLLPEQVTPGMRLIDLLRLRHSVGQLNREPEQLRTAILDGLSRETGGRFSYDTEDGRAISIVSQRMAGGGWVATHEDVTERRRAEAKIDFMARHDALTNLPNRRSFGERLQHDIQNIRNGESVAVLCLDLDRFKSVNDTLGHSLGDLLLKCTAQRLSSCLRETDMLARLGGDEFAVVLTGLTDPASVTALSARLIEAVAAPFDLDGHQVVIGVSIGIAMAPADGTDTDQLLKNADMALYRSKADGRGIFRFFEAEMDARMQTRRALELDLRKALATGEFELFYQPLVDAKSERIHGFEALIRWRHPQRGLVSPGEFIPLAEETGLIVPIGEWALHQACKEAIKWPEELSVAVNLSSVQFKGKKLVPTVVDALTRSGLSPSRLELEITESVLLEDSQGTLDMLHQLRALGIKISMDDFGTGYSSLGYLRKFPFDKIKIDGSFVKDLPQQSDSLAIVRAVVAIGASLGIHTTAEGVETAEQFERLAKEGCSEVQGFFFGRPCPASQVLGLLATKTPPQLKVVA